MPPFSDVEANLPQLREQFVLHNVVEVIETGRSSPELTARPVLVASPEHAHASAHPLQRRFDRFPSFECGMQLER
jgi:hypothetical protein